MKTWDTQAATYSMLQHLPALATTAAVATIGAGLAIWWMAKRRPSAEELERRRRERLVRDGRIMDGTVLDWSEQRDSGDLRTLYYRYAIAGVSYECAQDLSCLKDVAKVDASCLGMPASVRYDPKNPANSIIVAETWNGLRHRRVDG